MSLDISSLWYSPTVYGYGSQNSLHYRMETPPLEKSIRVQSKYQSIFDNDWNCCEMRFLTHLHFHDGYSRGVWQHLNDTKRQWRAYKGIGQVLPTVDGYLICAWSNEGENATSSALPILGLPMKKPKVIRFQICFTRTKYLSELYKNRTLKVCAEKLFSVNSSQTWKG